MDHGATLRRFDESAGRVVALDGLRGVAALVVVLGHAFGSFVEPVVPISFNGTAAVQLFFVLSGYCLAASLERDNGDAGLLRYWVRRLFRIYPPYQAAILVALVASSAFPSIPPGGGLSDWAVGHAAVAIDPWQIARAFVLPGSAGGLLPVGWTLNVELKFSLVLPLLIVPARRSGRWSLLAAGLIVLVVPPPAHVSYVWHFVLGVVAFVHRGELARRVDAIPGALRGAVPLASLAILFTPEWQDVSGRMQMLVYGAASASLVFSCVHLPGWRRAFEVTPIAWLGRVSYSLYLFHFTVLLLSLRLASERPFDRVEALGVVAVVVTGSCAAASLFHRLVEVPSIRLGGVVGDRIRPR